MKGSVKVVETRAELLEVDDIFRYPVIGGGASGRRVERWSPWLTVNSLREVPGNRVVVGFGTGTEVKALGAFDVVQVQQTAISPPGAVAVS